MKRISSRAAGECRACFSMLQLLCALSVWRTAITQILPLCSTAAWWVTIQCLMPGLVVTGLLRLAMKLTGSATLTEAVRVCTGRAGAWAVSVIFAVLLLTEALSGLTALITLFTEGVGTRGTAFTLALLTGGALLLCLHREGLPRAVYFLRRLMAAAAVIVAVCMLPRARADQLFPVWGEGAASVAAALKAGISLAWPVALLLTVPDGDQGRLQYAVLPLSAVVAALLTLTLTIPQELIAGQEGVAKLLLLPAQYGSNSLRLLYLCLLMAGIFLSIAAAILLATENLRAPLKTRVKWLPYVVLALLILTQTGDAARIWAALSTVNQWLLLPLAVVALLSVPIACIRRKRS